MNEILLIEMEGFLKLQLRYKPTDGGLKVQHLFPLSWHAFLYYGGNRAWRLCPFDPVEKMLAAHDLPPFESDTAPY